MATISLHASEAVRICNSRDELINDILKGAKIENGVFELIDEELFLSSLPTIAANTADFGDKSAPLNVRRLAAWIIGEAARSLNVLLNSPAEFYHLIATGEIQREMSFPAINIRSNTLDTGRALFRAVKDNKVGAFIVEIARSEIGYTAQSPMEYAAVVQAAAMLEGYRGYIFLQGDHIQLKAGPVNKGGEAAENEFKAHRALIRELMEYGFGSIDLDMSPFEKRNDDSLSFSEQQEENARLTAEKIHDVRKFEKELGLPWTTLLGGETGEVGKMNTRKEDLLAYAEGISKHLAELEKEFGEKLTGIGKIAVNDGTSHGGIVLPDGGIAEIAIAFDVLEMATKVGREFGWAGAVQHGASTLPDNAFSLFPKHGAIEVHLATGFQNILMDEGAYKVPGKQAEIERFLVDNFLNEWKATQTFAQFAYKTRKRANGPFKFDFWTMPLDIRNDVAEKLYDKFSFLFEQLNVVDTADVVANNVTKRVFKRPFPEETEEPESATGRGDDAGDEGLAD